MNLRPLLLLPLVFAVWSAQGNEAALPEKIEFNRHVRPILSDNCFYCHGPDASHRKADLRLDDRAAALELLAIVPNKPAESYLIERITTTDADDLMPPPDSHKKLTARDKAILERWIAQGAEYQKHWSYEQPVKASGTPTGSAAVDHLVAARLKEVGLKASPKADRRILIRRLYADLLGLPPKPEEVAAFVNDPAPDAYERLVDAILKNPHYGERMAMGWLDVVRFADTIGYHSDVPRNVWPYRDWVIRAYNTNKPFDRFTQEQLAGDLLPDANQETRLGSAFNRLLLSTEEGGAQAKDYEQRMLTDRVRAVGAAWLGQTTGCAQCHDHKFDPFTSRDFYALGAFFADVQEPIIGQREPGMVVATEAENVDLARLDAALEAATRKVAAVRPKLEEAQRVWEADLAASRVSLPSGHSAKAKAALAKKPATRKTADLEAIRELFHSQVSTIYRAELDALAKAKAERDALYNRLPKCLVTASASQKRVVRILPRGNWMDETGEVVSPSLPKYLPQLTVNGRELNRLDLANWLVSKEHPLTARTVMNRLWKQLFGTGLSKVLDDLGAQGELPPNQPLLDWLACEFMDSGWDFRHMVRLIVTSHTYQQVSTATPEMLAIDPYNREHARQSPFRLDAELVRDYALAYSGLLNPDLGGPSVKPYQPDGYWENLNFPTRPYVQDTGKAQYRRGLYVWWQRTFLHPSLLAFDAPSREEACAERSRSNIPQQALVLMNDPTYVEAARGLAARILSESAGGTEARVKWAFQCVLQRDPSAEEARTLVALFERQHAEYTREPAAAAALLTTGLAPKPELNAVDVAAWTHVSRVLINLHETITRS